MLSGNESGLSLLCRVEGRLFALPLVHVVETMRALPVKAVASAPGFVPGVAIIRGVPVPVVDAAALFGAGRAAATRFVTLRVDQRQIALAVEAVIGVRSVSGETLGEMPPLLRGAQADVVSSIGALDAELLLVLSSARVVPDSLWRALESEEPAT
jgi:purine-binding chemotaxis protein CheW